VVLAQNTPDGIFNRLGNIEANSYYRNLHTSRNLE